MVVIESCTRNQLRERRSPAEPRGVSLVRPSRRRRLRQWRSGAPRTNGAGPPNTERHARLSLGVLFGAKWGQRQSGQPLHTHGGNADGGTAPTTWVDVSDHEMYSQRNFRKVRIQEGQGQGRPGMKNTIHDLWRVPRS